MGVSDQRVVLPPAIPDFLIPGAFDRIDVDLLNAANNSVRSFGSIFGSDPMALRTETNARRRAERFGRTAMAALDEHPGRLCSQIAQVAEAREAQDPRGHVFRYLEPNLTPRWLAGTAEIDQQ